LQPFKKGDVSRDIGRTKGGLNHCPASDCLQSLRRSKLQTVCDGAGKPVLLYLTAGQVSDDKGARKLLDDFPAAKHLLADRGYDADWFRDGLLEKGITPCIPPRKNRKRHIPYDEIVYKQRHKVENMFGRLKDLLSGYCFAIPCRAKGGAYQPDTTAVLTRSSLQFVSQHLLYFGFNES
jgi:transposase